MSLMHRLVISPAFWRVMDLRPAHTGLGLPDGRVHEAFSSEQVEIITNSFKGLAECSSKVAYPVGERLLVLLEKVNGILIFLSSSFIMVLCCFDHSYTLTLVMVDDNGPDP